MTGWNSWQCRWLEGLCRGCGGCCPVSTARCYSAVIPFSFGGRPLVAGTLCHNKVSRDRWPDSTMTRICHNQVSEDRWSSNTMIQICSCWLKCPWTGAFTQEDTRKTSEMQLNRSFSPEACFQAGGSPTAERFLPIFSGTLVEQLPSPAVKWAGLVTEAVLQRAWFDQYPGSSLRRRTNKARGYVIQLAMAWDEAFISSSDDGRPPRTWWAKARRLRRIAPDLQRFPPARGLDGDSSSGSEDLEDATAVACAMWLQHAAASLRTAPPQPRIDDSSSEEVIDVSSVACAVCYGKYEFVKNCICGTIAETPATSDDEQQQPSPPQQSTESTQRTDGIVDRGKRCVCSAMALRCTCDARNRHISKGYEGYHRVLGGGASSSAPKDER